MALRNLTIEEMVETSSPWVQPGNAAQVALQSHQAVRGVLPLLGQAHAALLLYRPAVNNPRRAEISQVAQETDAAHDALARGIYGYLTETAILDANGSELLITRDALFPKGLAAAVQSTFLGEAGHCAIIRERLTPALQARLEKCPLPSGNLWQTTLSWLGAGDRLGRLEEQRGRLEENVSNGLVKIAARNRWQQAVGAVMVITKLSPTDEVFERTVFGSLRSIEAKADARAARRSAASIASPAETQSDAAAITPMTSASHQPTAVNEAPAE